MRGLTADDTARTAVRHHEGMTRERVVVAALAHDDEVVARALRAARAASGEGAETVFLGAAGPDGVARAAVAEDAARVLVVGGADDEDAVRRALAALGADDVAVDPVR